MKDSDKDIDKAVVALSALPVAPACKRAPKQNKGDSKRCWRMVKGEMAR